MLKNSWWLEKTKKFINGAVKIVKAYIVQITFRWCTWKVHFQNYSICWCHYFYSLVIMVIVKQKYDCHTGNNHQSFASIAAFFDLASFYEHLLDLSFRMHLAFKTIYKWTFHLKSYFVVMNIIQDTYHKIEKQLQKEWKGLIWHLNITTMKTQLFQTPFWKLP